MAQEVYTISPEYLVISERRTPLKTAWVMSKELRSHLEETPTGQSCNNLSFRNDNKHSVFKSRNISQSMSS